MDLTEAHDLLFKRYLDASSRLYELEQYHEYTQAYLHRERDYFRDEAHPDLEIEFLPLFKDTFPPILNASVIVATAMLLEQEVRELAAALTIAFSLKVKLNDLTGSVLERFRTLATKIVDLTIESTRFQWADLSGLFELRNCIVHSQGQLSDFQRAATVVAFASKHQPSLVVGNKAVPTDETSMLALQIASRFLLAAYASALQRCPGPYSEYIMAEMLRGE